MSHYNRKRKPVKTYRTIARADVKGSPTTLKPVRGDSYDIDLYVAKRLNALDKLLAPEYIRLRYLAPDFTKGTAGSSNYNPDAPGKLSHNFYFFPVLEFTVVESDEEGELSGTLQEFFASAEPGSRASWSLRAPSKGVQDVEDYSIIQTLGVWKNKGIATAAIRNVIETANKRLAGYAVVTGVRGVWRSPFSLEDSEKQFAKNRATKEKDLIDRAAIREKKARKREREKKAKQRKLEKLARKRARVLARKRIEKKDRLIKQLRKQISKLKKKGR